jgi:NAD(P)-dependent dehydrogenase (short-subunit alcohol dehydrogenase family)
LDDLPSFDLSGKVALVTGAGRGLGRAIALALAGAGADVALGLRDIAADGGVAGAIATMGRKALTLQMDVTDLNQARAAFDRAVEVLGGVDILVNNAGGGIGDMALDVTEDDFDAVVALNVKSTFFLSQTAARHMIERGRGGRIINLSSQAGVVALPGESVYCLSKAAVSHLTRCMAVEWGEHGITVNAICPGFFPSKMTQATLEAQARLVLELTPTKRLGNDEDLKGLVVLLASEASRHITGQAIAVDGGASVL